MEKRRPDQETSIAETMPAAEPRPSRKRVPKKQSATEDTTDQPEEPAEQPVDQELGPEPTVEGEAARQRVRVELARLLEQLPEDVAERVKRVTERFGGRWWLEQGRFVYTTLVREQVIKDAGEEGRVTIRQRLPLYRQQPPLPEERVIAAVTEAVDQDEPEQVSQRLAELAATLPAGDELVVTVERPGQPPHRYEVGPTAVSAEDEAAPVLARVAETLAQPRPTPPAAERDATDELINITWQEPVEITKEEETEPPSIGRVIDDIAGHLDLLVELPPIAGGAEVEPPEPAEEATTSAEPPPPPEPLATEQPLPPSEPEPPIAAEPPATPERRPRPHRRRRPWPPIVPVLERGWPEPRPLPSLELRTKARKLLRILSRQYGLRLTPAIETYLLAIMLRPRRIGGRLVYGLGVNRDVLLGVLMELRLHYQPYQRPRP